MTSFEVMHEVDEAILKIGDDFDTEFLSSMEEKTPSYQKIGHVDFLEIKFKDLPTTCRVSPDYSEWSTGPSSSPASITRAETLNSFKTISKERIERKRENSQNFTLKNSNVKEYTKLGSVNPRITAVHSISTGHP